MRPSHCERETLWCECVLFIAEAFQFDKLPSSQPPPGGYVGLTWDGWRVDTLDSAGIPGFAITTKPNILTPDDSLSAQISINNGSATGFKLQSFNLACVGLRPGTTDQIIPVNCTIAVTTRLPFRTVLYQYTGATNTPTMQRFPTTQQGSEAQFSLVGAPLGRALLTDTAFYMDRVVVTDTGTCGAAEPAMAKDQQGGKRSLFGSG